VTQVVGTLATMGRGGKGGLPAPIKTTNLVKVTRTLPRPGNPVTNPAVRAAVKKSRVRTAPEPSVRPQGKNASPPSAASGTTGLNDVLAQVQQHLQLPEFKTKLAKSNLPSEIQRQNKAIQAMRDKGKLTASLTQPDGSGAVPAALGRVPKSSNEPVAMGLKMRYFANTVKAIANNTLFDNYLSTLHGAKVENVVRGGSIFNRYMDEIAQAKIDANPHGIHAVTIGDLSARYRKASAGDVPGARNNDFLPQVFPNLPSSAHNTHTAFGAVSKVGEVMANTNALSLDLALPNVTSWASRGLLPTKSAAASTFWKVDLVQDWVNAEKSLAALEAASKSTSGRVVAGEVQQLLGGGFLPKGSALAKHLERIETTAFTRDKVFGDIPMAKPSDLSKMMKTGRAAEQLLAQDFAALAASSKQSRAHVMHQSFGTPDTTYALTTRHAAAARYMRTIEGQERALFDANTFRRILKEVEGEAGPAAETGPLWHKQMLETYASNHFFQDAMNANPAMGQAWRDYKAQFGVQ
jgi:hypothetical protein